MASYKIELNSKPVKGTLEYKLMLRITVNKKHSRIILPYAIKKKQFNPTPQNSLFVRQSHPKHKLINGLIDRKIQEAKDVTERIEKEGKLLTAIEIKKRMLEPKSLSFIDYADAFIEESYDTDRYGNYKKNRTILNKLKKFLNGEDLLFSQIDSAFLNKYRSYLEKLGNNPNSIHSNFRGFKVIYYKARDEGIVKSSENPFQGLKLRMNKPQKIRLTIEEINLIENLELEEGSLLWHVRNAFLFSFYNAGIRISDILQMKWKNIIDNRLVYQMHKTSRFLSIKLKEKPLRILEYYQSNDPDDFIFPFLRSDVDYSDKKYLFDQLGAKTALINKYLKELAKKASIYKKISTHTARHSFADIARKKTDNIYNLSKTLGHSDLKITEAYLASFDEDAVDSTMDNVFDDQ